MFKKTFGNWVFQSSLGIVGSTCSVRTVRTRAIIEDNIF
jgi:hypothetical protein